MKNVLLITILYFSFQSCTTDDNEIEATALNCEDAKAALENLGDDASCDDNLRILKNIKEVCGDSEDTIQSQIDIIEALCEVL